MAGFGSSQTSGGGSYSAPAKQWTPPPQTPAVAGALAGARVGAAPAQAPAQAPQATGGAAVNAFKQTSTYVNSVLSVFKAQNPFQQQKIVQGAARNPNTPESKAILDYVKSTSQQGAASGAAAGAAGGTGVLAGTHAPQTSASAPISPQRGPVGDVGHFLAGIGLGTHAPTTQQFQQTYGGVAKAASGAVGSVFDLAHQLPLSKPIGTNEKVASAAGFSAPDVAKNVAKDAVDFYAGAPSSIGTVAADALKNPAKGLQDIIGPYKQLLKDPQQAFVQHPFLTAAMIGAPLHGGSRLLAAPVRALAPADSAVGRALSTARPGVQLTGNLTHERLPYSPSPTAKLQFQKSADNLLYTQNPQGQLIPRAGVTRDRLIHQGVSDLFNAQERVRRVNRQAVVGQRQSAVSASLPGKLTQAVKGAPKYGSAGQATIPGANMLARIADLTIRRPDTWSADLQKHLDHVKANRPNLLDNKDLLAQHDAYVKQVQRAISSPPSAKNMQRLFRAAEQYRKDYTPTQLTASALGHFGTMTSDALQRRDLMHYAVTHMGARMDPELGLVRDVPNPEAAIARGRRAANVPATIPQKLSNAAILDHLKGPQGSLGRLPAYTPDYPKRGSAYYVSSERRPLPATAKNTLFAYTHGLTDAGHQALTDQHVRMQGIVDAHRAQNEYLNTLAVAKKDGGFWGSYREAMDNRLHQKQVPINVSQPFHPQQSLDQALKDVNPATVEDEAAKRGLSLDERLRPESPGGRWALIDQQALKSLQKNRDTISPGALGRAFRGANTLFRQTALGTSAKHIPGVTTENVLRDIQYGIGFRSWLTGQRAFNRYQQLHGTAAGREMRARLGGGQAAGATDLLSTHSTAEHYRGTSLYPFVRGMENLGKVPGPKQLRAVWKAYSHFVIQGTKHVLETQHQKAALGKFLLREHGYAQAAKTQGALGLVGRMLSLHGQMLDDAVRGFSDPAKVRQMRAVQKQFFGNWTDLTPEAKTLLMFSPFGMWWVNSAKFLARMPVDAPVKSGVIAAATQGTEQQRQARGLQMWGPNHLPLYQQGAIPVKGGVLAQNYYSPFGIANDPLETAQGLIDPWLQPLLSGAAGDNWLGKQLSSTQKPRGGDTNPGQRALYIINSALSSFVPLYQKAQQVAAGGASTYDVPSQFPLPTIKAGQQSHGPVAGLKKAFTPYRFYPTPKAKGSTGGGLPKLPELPKLPKLPALPK